MAWNDNPKVRQLAEYAKEHGFEVALAVGIKSDGQFELVSYGATKQLCSDAEKLSNDIYRALMDGKIEVAKDSWL